MVLARREVSKDAELLLLRHENAVLRRQTGRVRCQAGDRLWLATLSRLIPPLRRHAALPVIRRLSVAVRYARAIGPCALACWHDREDACETAATEPWAVSRPADPALTSLAASHKPLNCTVLHCPAWISARGPVLTFCLTSCQESGAWGFVEGLVRLQAEAAGDDFLLDLRGAAEDRLDGAGTGNGGPGGLLGQPSDDLVGRDERRPRVWVSCANVACRNAVVQRRCSTYITGGRSHHHHADGRPCAVRTADALISSVPSRSTSSSSRSTEP
jgi:hypothetical protein